MLAPCGHGDMWRDNMTTETEDFYDSGDDALTTEQALQALAELEGAGDTGKQPDNGGAPTTTTAKDQPGDAADGKPKDSEADKATKTEGDGKDGAQTPEDQLNADNAVVLAKDGKHTIPFDRLEKARQGEQHWRAQAEAAQRQLAELQAQAQARADAGQAPTKTDNMVATAEAAIEAGVDASLFGDFSEEALAKGIKTLVAQQVQAQVAQAIQPIQAKHQQDAMSEHERVIYAAHPNADSIVQSTEFAAWVDSHPTTVRNALWQTFDTAKGGTAAEVVEVLDAYAKAAASQQKTPPTTAAAKDAAKSAIAATQAEPPSSLSSIPGGRVDGRSVFERMDDMTGEELYAATEDMTPEQVDQWLARSI